MDIRTSTYDELLSDYAAAIPSGLVSEVDPNHVERWFDVTKALAGRNYFAGEVWGEPVRTADYPAGTWFYYGEEAVSVRLAGEEFICRMEMR